MTSFNDPIKRRKIIMERYKQPKFSGELDVEPITKFSNQCVDNVKLFIKWRGGKIIDAKHISEGCAVFISSTDLFVEKMKGLTKEALDNLIREYNEMINQRKFNEEVVGDLIIFDNVKTHLNRLLCANMIVETLK